MEQMLFQKMTTLKDLTSYNPIRGNKVISYAKEFLDKNFPLQNCSHKDVNSYKIEDNSLLVDTLNGTNSHLKNKKPIYWLSR